MKVQEYIEQQNASTNVLGKMKIQIFIEMNNITMQQLMFF